KWKSSEITKGYFRGIEARYQVKQKLELIEHEKTIELAEIERIKVSQTRNHVKSTMKVHQEITKGIVTFSQKQNDYSKSSKYHTPEQNITSENEEKQDKDEESTTIERNEEENSIASDSENYLKEVVESMVGKLERTPLTVDDIDMEKIFIDYRNQCNNIFNLCHSDIMDMRPTSRFTNDIAEESWNKFVLNTYPKHNLPKDWESFIQEFFKSKDSLKEWTKVWRELYSEETNKKNKDLKDLIDAIYNILGTYIKAFEAPHNILKSGDLRENQYNAQFISPILENTLKTICNIDWRILEVPVESSKDRCNANINPIVDKVLEAKCADGLACLWRSREEVFLYEQTGPPDFDDITQLHIHDYKLVRTMRDVLNQLIILRFKDGIYDHKDLASFSAFGHRTEVSLFWLTIHQKSYCLREYGTFKIPAIWQDIPILCEAIITCLKFFVSITKFCPFIHCFLLTPVYAQSFMKENIEKRSPYIEQKQKLLTKRKVHTIKQNQSTPNRPKKQKISK
ncbi:2302_t:CDS:2, partial [Entrophospora sp. SA101]